jgi:hypothetical protein
LEDIVGVLRNQSLLNYASPMLMMFQPVCKNFLNIFNYI